MRTWTVLFAAAGLAVSGCGGNAAPDPAVPAQHVGVQVTNQSDYSVEIFAYRNRLRTPLGMVASGKTEVLPFDWDFSTVRFVIDFVGDDYQNHRAEIEKRNEFAADPEGTVPCIMTAEEDVVPGVLLTLVVPKGLEETSGRSRCGR